MDTRPGLEAALAAEGRCKHTGGRYVCGGHFDYFGSYLVWTRHAHRVIVYRVVPYDHPAPEIIPDTVLRR